MTAQPRHRRLRLTTPPEAPRSNAREGKHAAHWRERQMGWSRPNLAARLGTTSERIARLEKLSRVPIEFRLACAALASGLDEFAWEDTAQTENARRDQAWKSRRKLSTGEAAKLAGVSRAALTAAIRNGRLRATRAKDDSYRIGPRALARWCARPAAAIAAAIAARLKIGRH